MAPPSGVEHPGHEVFAATRCRARRLFPGLVRRAAATARPRPNSPVQTIVPASVSRGGHNHRFPCPKPCRSASAIASRQRRWAVAREPIFDAKPELRQAAHFEVGPGRSPGARGGGPPAGDVQHPLASGDHASTVPRFISGGPLADRCRARFSSSDCPVYRGGKEPHLLDDVGQVSAPARQPQLERCDCHAEAALAI